MHTSTVEAGRSAHVDANKMSGRFPFQNAPLQRSLWAPPTSEYHVELFHSGNTRRMTRKRAAAILSLFCAHTLESSSLSASKEDLKVLVDQTQLQSLGKEFGLVRMANQAKAMARACAFLTSGRPSLCLA
ncbi:hypothetical protein WJX77_001989 [Trebouxia sp. C0004]